MSKEFPDPIKQNMPNIPNVPPDEKTDDKKDEEPKDPKSPEKQEDVEVEKELSLEVIEMIMSKVRDINEAGQAFHILAAGYGSEKFLDKLRNILCDGLLGTSEDQQGLNRSDWFGKNDKKKYIELLKNKKNNKFSPDVFFNILGRRHYDLVVPEQPEFNDFKKMNHYPFLGKTKWDWTSHLKKLKNITNIYPNYISLAILFDKSNYNEVNKDAEEKLQTFTYTVYPGRGGKVDKDEKKQTIFGEEFGFRLSTRVTPRYFQGIVLNIVSLKKLNKDDYEERIKETLERNRTLDCATYEKDENWLREQVEYRYIEDNSSDFSSKYIQKIAKIIKQIDQINSFVPIYDAGGNLLWPRQMSYEEVKKFVAERDKEKNKETKDRGNDLK